jgi:hypothetical protein
MRGLLSPPARARQPWLPSYQTLCSSFHNNPTSSFWNSPTLAATWSASIGPRLVLLCAVQGCHPGPRERDRLLIWKTRYY